MIALLPRAVRDGLLAFLDAAARAAELRSACAQATGRADVAAAELDQAVRARALAAAVRKG